MKVEEWEISRIKLYEKNPRVNDHAVDDVAKSITSFGFQQPIVVDKDGVIVVGHTRFKAAKKLKMAKVPVVVAEGLTPEQIRAYRIADNRTGEMADWDWSLLATELNELKNLQIDLEATGFTNREHKKMVVLVDRELTPDDVAEDNPKLAAFLEARRKARARTKEDAVLEMNFWTCLVFQSWEQKQEFLKQCAGLDVRYGMYVDGRAFAAKFGITLKPDSAKGQRNVLDKSLAGRVE